MFIISETKRNRINSLMFRPTVTPDYDKLADGIKNLTKLQGEFEIADDVKHAMDKWYTTFVTDHEDKIDDDTGFVNRIQDMILKVAMLVSCARRGDQIITIEDMEEAVSETLPLIVPTKKVAQSVKINDISAVQKRALIIKDLANREDHSAGRVELLKKFSLQMDHEDLDRVIQFLESAQVIRTDKPGGHIRYSLNMSNEKVSNWIQENYKR
jgi:hypothetical protein